MITARQHKEFRIVCKLRDVSHRLPSAADAAFFLRNAVRFERVRAGRGPFQQKDMFDSGVQTPRQRNAAKFYHTAGTAQNTTAGELVA